VSLPKLPALPVIPATADPEMQQFLQSVKSVLDNLSGANGAATAALTADAVTSLVTSQTAAIAAQVAASGSTTTTSSTTTPIAKSPVALTGLTAIGGFANVMLEWGEIPGNSAYTTIYRAAVDDFSQATPIGTSRFRLYVDYVPNYQDYYYWITTVTDEGLEGPPNSPDGTQAASTIDAAFLLEQLDRALSAQQIVAGGLNDENVFADAIIGTAAIKDAAIVDAHIMSVGADKIAAASLSAITADLGQVTAGRMLSPDGTFLIDLDNREIIISGDAGPAADTYTVIRNGQIETWLYDGSVHSLAKSLTHIEVGTAANDSWVEIPGSFLTIPKVMVSPYVMRAYDKDYPTQHQTLRCAAIDLQQLSAGSNRWKFKALAQLELEGSNPSTNVGYYPAAGTGTMTCPPGATTTFYTTQSNTASVRVNVYASSIRGKGTPSNEWYRRKVAFNLYARLNGTSNSFTQVYSGSYIVLPGSIDPAAVVDCSFTATFSGANKWDFYITAVYADEGTTFLTSGPTTETAVDTIDGTSGTYDKSDELIGTPLANESKTLTKQVKSPLPTYTLPSGWSYAANGVKYEWESFGYAEITNLPDPLYWGSHSASTKSFLRAVSTSFNGTAGSLTSWVANSTTASSYNKDSLVGTLETKWYSDGNVPGTRFVAKGGFRKVKVTITRTKALTNSTTAANIVQVIDFISNTSGATVLATGSLNWVAVG